MTTIDPRTYQAIAIATALEIWAERRIQVNTSYTPKNMILTATRITGKTYKPRDYLLAATDLREWVRNKFT